jgi:hypothetical protein
MKDELRAAFEELTPPVHPALSANIREAIAEGRRPRRSDRRWVAPAGAALLAVLVLVVGIRFAPGDRPNITLPAQPPQPITRTSPGAQVAWLWLSLGGGQSGQVAVDPAGNTLFSTNSLAGIDGAWRSPDGATVYTISVSRIFAQDAASGRAIRDYARPAGSIVGQAFSPDGRYLALMSMRTDFDLSLLDLQTGAGMDFSLPRDTNAVVATPAFSGSGSWSVPVFGTDSSHLFTVTSFGGPARVTALQVVDGRLLQLATASVNLPTCGAPAAKVVADGQTLVVFCHSNGQVWFVDLRNLSLIAVVDSHQPNPHWFSPIFTPDGKRLYLHQDPGFGDKMTLIDLTSRKLYGPVSTPQDPSLPGPFDGLITQAHAGFVASTVPLSPDGLTLYSASPHGILALRVPDLKPLARLAPGANVSEVWVSGDGKTLFATTSNGKSLLVMRSDGSDRKTVSLPADARFIASEHG